MDTYVYEYGSGLYVNLTNRCNNNCAFCLRHTNQGVGRHRLWLEHEPTAEQVIEKTQNLSAYEEVVFCGFGEPTEALETLLATARLVREEYGKLIRINTNGLGSLIHGRDIAPEFAGLVDTVSISLNTPNADRYHELVRSKFGDKSFEAMLDFARECVKYVPNVVMSTVDTTITKEEERQCQIICDEIGAKYRIRPWEDGK